MANLERVYTIPIAKDWLKVPVYKRAKKSIIGVRNFLTRHMKSEDIRLGKALNEAIWVHGMKNPPRKVKVNVTKDDKGVVRAELFGTALEQKAEAKAEQKTEAKETKQEKAEAKKAEVQPAIESKKAEVKKAPAQTEKTESAKKEQKKTKSL